MKNLLNQEWFKGVVVILMAAGILAVVFGTWQYFDTSRKLEGNLAHQLQNAGEEVQVDSTAQAQGLVASDLQRRDLLQQRYQAMIIGGVGLVLLGMGWLALDFSRKNSQKPRTAAP